MAQWQIKELSDLTGVSVRTLHHYDHVGLLKPSVRSANKYRWYSESDVVKLQQILALKSFGFGLSQIKTMLQHQLNILEHLQIQEKMLKEQVIQLQQMQEAVTTVIQKLKTTGSLDWKNCITLIERYRMTEELKKTWAGKALDEAQLAEYTAIRQLYPKEFGLWEKTITEINEMQLGDPEGPDGERIVKIFLDVAKKTKDTMAQQRKFNSGILRSIKEGKISNLPLSPEGSVWLGKASLAYWLKRWENIYEEIVKNLSSDPAGAAGKKVAKKWRDLINDHFMGSSPELLVGTMIWQEEARQRAELATQIIPLTAEEMVKKIHVKLFFNPAAFSWIEKALDVYQD